MNKIRKLIPYLISHHPMCDFYQNHTINIVGLRICRGCTLFVLGAIFSLILVNTISLNDLHPVYLMILGILSFASYGIYLFSLTEKLKRIASIFVHFTIGSGFIVGCFGISQITSLKMQFLSLYLYMNIILSFYAIKLVSDIRSNDCAECHHVFECKGLKRFYDVLIS